MRIESGEKKHDKITYDEYLVKVNKRKKQSIMMFISVFMVLLIIFLGFAKIMSPEVDITIGDDSAQTQFDVTQEVSGVDARLKQLQEEDESNAPSLEEITEEDGLVKIPKTKKEDTLSTIKDEEPVATKQPEETHANQVTTAPAPTPAPTEPAIQNTVTYRVYVGSYTSQAQADVAKGILQEAGLGVVPHIKLVNGTYTLQVGAYSSKTSAQNLANKLLMNNYPARVVSEN